MFKLRTGGKFMRVKLLLGLKYELIQLVQPSSAAAERVVSLLQNSFSNRQQSSLEDYISLSVMLQYIQR